MAVLSIDDMPDDLYARLSQRAVAERRSLPAEALALLEDVLRGSPVPSQSAQQAALLAAAARLRATQTPAMGRYPSSWEMIREERSR